MTIDCACLPTLRYVAFALLSSACAGGGPIGSQAWAPPPAEDDDEGASSSSDGGDTGETICEPGLEVACACAGGDAGVRTCLGDGWTECDCEGSESSDEGTDTATPGTASADGTSGSSEDESDGGEPMPANEACFPGSANDWTTCLPLHAFAADQMPDGYGYPEALDGDPNYRKPIAFIDLQELDGAMLLAPNFALSELAQIEKGRYAIVQPHAVASLQELRDALGAIGVNSGYRSPSYNVQIGGATWSRHMYGDGFDLDPIDAGLTTLETQCTAIGGFLVEYDTHVHCDFRDDAVDEGFFGAAGEDSGAPPSAFATTIVEHGDGVYTATATGFDEGEPKRHWVALDEDGNVVVAATGAVFLAPESTATVEVVVGGVVTDSRERP